MQDTGVSGKRDKRASHQVGRIPAALAPHRVTRRALYRKLAHRQ
jgi:hypothetical protein